MKDIRIKPTVIAAIALAGVTAAAAGGYWFGRHGERTPAQSVSSSMAAQAAQNAVAPPASRTPLYYQDPDGKPDYSPTPKKAADGRDFIPVYEDNPPPVAGSPSAAAQTGQQGKGHILYYRNPMGLPDTSPVPKKDSMGMAYIPVYEGEAPSDTGIVQVSPGRMQMLGVRTAAVELQPALARTLRANGIVEIDERAQAVVTTKVAGWIERLNVAATGQAVRRGQALFELYSPDLNAAEQEFLIATQLGSGDHSENAHAAHQAIIDAALQRLRALDVPEDEIVRLRRTAEVSRRITVPAPGDGIVLEKQAVEGMHIEPGMPLYKIGDLSMVWLIAEVQEQDLGSLPIGAPVHAFFVSYPGRVFNGKIDFIYPTMAAETRTGRVRIVLANPGLTLRTAMYASVEIDVPSATSGGKILVVPDSAVIDSGARQAVLVARGEGRFEPRAVRIGVRGNGYVQVLEGLKQDEQVVTSANFLIDAESNLRAALSSFAAGQSPSGAATPAPGAKP